MTLLQPIQSTTLLLPYEQMFIHRYHQKGKLIPEQQRGEPNPLLQRSHDNLHDNTNLTDYIHLSGPHITVSAQIVLGEDLPLRINHRTPHRTITHLVSTSEKLYTIASS
jgi:hypothetical protein